MVFDMVRVRMDGWVVPRHNSGLLRPVRGEFTLREVWTPKLNRHVRTAFFHTGGAEQDLLLFDAALVHATSEMLVLSGFETRDDGVKPIDFAQTWVLSACEGEAPEASRGPAFLR